MGVTTVIKDYGTDILDAIRQNNMQKLQIILEKQLKSDSKIAKLCITDIKHKPSKKFACPLILAARLEDPTILHYMISKGTEPNFVHHTIYSSKRREIVTALHIAVDLGFYDTTEVLLSVNADCNIGDHNQETPLHIAIKKADRIMSRMLLSKGADPTIPDRNGNAALHTATLYGHLELVKTLLKYDADIFQKGHLNAIAPHIAAREGHIHLIQLFCGKHMANINVKIPCFADGREKTPLHLSSEHGHFETSRALMEQYEAEVNIKDSDGNTPLHCCVLNPYDPHRLRDKDSFTETARILIKHRVSINSKNAFGDTALHLAAMNHFQRIVEMLLEVGANPFIENNEKLKPIDVVPGDDPVTQQVLKMAMAQGPRPLKYPSPDTTLDKSSGTLSSGKTGSSRSQSGGHAVSLTTIGVGPEDSALDRSLSIYSSVSTLPSVFVDEAGQTKLHKHKHASKDDDKARTKAVAEQKQATARQVNSMQQTTEKEIQDLKYRGGKPPATRGTGRLSSADSSYMDDTYSFMSESTMQDGSTQTRERRGKDVAVMTRRDKKKSSNKRLQTSFDLDKSISMSDMTSQTDLSILAKGSRRKHDWYDHDPYETSRLKDKSHDPYKESSRHQGKHERRSKEDQRQTSKYTKDNRDDTLESVSTKGRKPKHSSRHKGKSQSSVDDEYSEEESEDESEEEGKSQVTPYSSKTAKQEVEKPPPGSVRVNTLPGKPGTIELQYSGGPLTIALDTQSFNNFPAEQQGEYFYDQKGNQYPVSLIHALQQAAGLIKGNQTPLVTTKTGDQTQQIFHSPLPPKPKKQESARINKPRAPTPPSDDEVIYANEEELQSMMDSSVASEMSPSHDFMSPHVMVKTAISQRVHEVTKTPKSPTNMSDRSTSTRAAKQHDHLKKILGRATPTKRGTTPTNVVPAGKKIFEFEEPVSPPPSEAMSSEVEVPREETISPPAIPTSALPRQPPQKQPRRSLQTPQMTEEETSHTSWLEEKAIHEKVRYEVITTSTKVTKTKKHPATPLVITRADDSFEEEYDDDPSSDQWDETPNASPEHKSFKQKLEWAKGLEEGSNTPSKAFHLDEEETKDMGRQEKVVEAPVAYSSRSRKSRPPLSPGYKKVVGGVIREEDEELEDILPEYKKSGQGSSSSSSEEESSEQEESEEESSNDEEEMIGERTSESHGVSSQAREVRTTVKTERVEVVTSAEYRQGQTNDSVEQLERLKAEAIEKQSQDNLQVAGKPGMSQRYGRELSPSGEYDTYLTGSGRQTPDSVYSEGSYSGRGLNMRVTGDTPKAYTHAEKEHKRVAWIKAKPVGIESGSEYSDNEFGSLSSLNRSLSPGGSERARKWSEENKPLYRKNTPTGTVYESRLHEPVDESQLQSGTSDEEGKSKMIGSYAKPYKSFGKIETKTDLLEEAMATSPMSPISPIDTIQDEDDDWKIEETLKTGLSKETSGTSESKRKNKFELRVSPAQFLETDPEKAHSMDSDEGPDIDSANTSVARSPFKKNIKMALPGPDLYETETVEQAISIGASEEDLLKAAEMNKRKHKRLTVTKTPKEETTVTKTVTSTVVSVVKPALSAQPQDTEYFIVSTESEDSDEDTSESEETESESDDIAQYNEHAIRLSKDGTEDSSSDIPAFNSEINETFAIVDTTLQESVNKPRIPSLAEPDDEFNDFNDVETVEIVHTKNTNVAVKHTPFEEFTQSPAISATKKVKKTKKNAKKGTASEEKSEEEVDPSVSMDIEEYGEEPGMRRIKKKPKSRAATKVEDQDKHGIVEDSVMSVQNNADDLREFSTAPLNGAYNGEDNTHNIQPKDAKEVKKLKKAKKKKVKVSTTESVNEENVQHLNISVPESEGFQYSGDTSLQQIESDQEYLEVNSKNNKNLESFVTGFYNEPVNNLQTNINNADISVSKTETVGTLNEVEAHKPTNNTVSDIQKQKVFETSFGPEDEEVAQINIAAAERTKKKKEKRKKIKKQEQVWAEEQKKRHENQNDVNMKQVADNKKDAALDKEGKNISGMDDPQGKPDESEFLHPPDELIKKRPPIPAAEITFSGGIEVIDETHKKKKKKRDAEDTQQKEKKKTKKKDEKIKKKKKSKPVTETADLEKDMADPTRTNRGRDDVHITEHVAAEVTAPIKDRSDEEPHVKDTSFNEGIAIEADEEVTSFPSETLPHDMAVELEEQHYITGSDNKAQLANKQAKELYNERITDTEMTGQDRSDEESISETGNQHYPEKMSSSEQERRMWEIYQRQRDKDNQPSEQTSASNHVKETDIDADIVETNIDDDVEEYYHEISEENMDRNNEPLKESHPVRQKKSRNQQNHTQEELTTDDSEYEESLDEDEDVPKMDKLKRSPRGRREKHRQHSSVALEKAGGQGSDILHMAGRPEETSQPPQHAWTDQKEQEEKMKQMLQSYHQDYDAASLDSEQFAVEYDVDPRLQPFHPPAGGRTTFADDDPRTMSLPAEIGTQSRQPQTFNAHRGERQPGNKPRSVDDSAVMAEMWGQQNAPQRRPDGHGGDRHRRADTTSDNESSSARRRRQKKKVIKFLEDAHSDADISQLDPLTVQPGKSLQEAAMETLTASLQHQPKLQPRKPIEAVLQERPINYTRGVYRPQPVHWRGSRINQSTSLSGRYDDSQLLPQMWSEHQQQGTESEGEGEPDVEYLQPISTRHQPPGTQSPTMHYHSSERHPQPGGSDYGDDEYLGKSPQGAFQPFMSYGGENRRHVQIYDAEAERRRREEREEHRARKKRKERAPKMDIGPVDFTKYPATAKLWMEQVDKDTVQKSKTMYLSVMPEGMKPPPELENSVPRVTTNERGEVFLPPQWVIARGRSLRRKKQRLDSQRAAAESLGSLSASGITSGESDYEDRPMSPGRQILLFFRVSSNWTDLAWVLFEGIQTDTETKRMLADIQIKHPRNLTKQVNSCMHRWWKKKGPDATIEELRCALVICSMPYIQEQYFENRKSTLTSYTDTEDDLDISQMSDNDPEVTRLIQEYEVRSLNASYNDVSGEHALTSASKMNMSKDSLMRRLEDKGVKIDRSRMASNLSATSRDSVFKRNSEMSLPTDRHSASQDYYDDYMSDGGDSRRAFVIVQPQLKQKDYNYESQI